MIRFFEYAGKPFVIMIEEIGRIMLLLLKATSWMIRPPFSCRVVFKQMEFVSAGINFSDKDVKALLTSVPLPK